MYRKNKIKTTNRAELLLFTVSIACMCYALLQTKLELWQVMLIIVSVILINLAVQLPILLWFKQRIRNKNI